MIILLHIFYVVMSIFLLWKGSDWLVDRAVRIAQHVGVSQLVIGLTIVAFGTSAPEFAVTIGAAVQGQANISVSNVIGSNVFNLGFILGGVSIIRAIQSSKQLIWRDGMLLVVATACTLLFLWDQHLSRFEGMILFLGLIVYNLFLIFQKKEPDLEHHPSTSIVIDGVVLVLGIVLVILGGYFLREGAVGIARVIGISEWVIGITVIAGGTSAPEFATSLMASLKGHHGISAGNLVGSCLFNILGVLGLAGFLRPMVVSPNVQRSLFMLMGLVIVALVVLRTRGELSRREGILLVGLSLLIWIVEFA